MVRVGLTDFFYPTLHFRVGFGLSCQSFLSFIYLQFIIIHIQSWIKYIKSSQTNTNQFIIIQK